MMAQSWSWGSQIAVKQVKKKDGLEFVKIMLFMSENVFTNPQDERYVTMT